MNLFETLSLRFVYFVYFRTRFHVGFMQLKNIKSVTIKLIFSSNNKQKNKNKMFILFYRRVSFTTFLLGTELKLRT